MECINSSLPRPRQHMDSTHPRQCACMDSTLVRAGAWIVPSIVPLSAIVAAFALCSVAVSVFGSVRSSVLSRRACIMYRFRAVPPCLCSVPIRAVSKRHFPRRPTASVMCSVPRCTAASVLCSVSALSRLVPIFVEPLLEARRVRQCRAATTTGRTPCHSPTRENQAGCTANVVALLYATLQKTM